MVEYLPHRVRNKDPMAAAAGAADPKDKSAKQSHGA